MKLHRIVLMSVLTAGLTACSSFNMVSRNEAPNQLLLQTQPGEVASASFSVSQLNVAVPADLVVSEGAGFYPSADIVWRGDPFGDRYQQIEAMFREGMGRGIEGLQGDRDVIVDVVVERFHSLTERTRYTVGGVHSIRFNLTVRDAATGEVIEPTRVVQADLRGFGGLTAVRAEAAGQTQKVRITDHLAQVILFEMSRPRDFIQV